MSFSEEGEVKRGTTKGDEEDWLARNSLDSNNLKCNAEAFHIKSLCIHSTFRIGRYPNNIHVQ